MKYIELEIWANEFQQEELIALLDDYNTSGFEQTDETLKAYFDEDKFSGDEIYKVLESYQYQKKEIKEQNWNSVWEDAFQPVVVENFCAIRAHFHQPIHEVEHDLIITPKMSFGTGHHATTYMMIQQMHNIDFKNKTVFDFGTGTGILAILAEKLGAKNITAIDVDEWSIENARENFIHNHCSNIAVSLSSILPNETFDVVLANINRNVILDYMLNLKKVVKKNGSLLLSGLLVSDEMIIEDAASLQGFELVQKATKDGWLSLLFVNNG